MTQPEPRVFLSAERSLLAWNRTCLAMMGLGFVIERFGLFLRLLNPTRTELPRYGASYWVGLSLMGFAALLAVLSTISFRDIVATLGPREVPKTPFAYLGVVANIGIAVAGIGLTAFLALAAR